ncbi:uncharacterized protein [Centruroides vittatus]|uniref:uncharacterized protein n=1 Tax=Centruroides vittatus TaxID=120091 RepID=UPI003510AC58
MNGGGTLLVCVHWEGAKQSNTEEQRMREGYGVIKHKGRNIYTEIYKLSLEERNLEEENMIFLMTKQCVESKLTLTFLNSFPITRQSIFKVLGFFITQALVVYQIFDTSKKIE